MFIEHLVLTRQYSLYPFEMDPVLTPVLQLHSLRLLNAPGHAGSKWQSRVLKHSPVGAKPV